MHLSSFESFEIILKKNKEPVQRGWKPESRWRGTWKLNNPLIVIDFVKFNGEGLASSIIY